MMIAEVTGHSYGLNVCISNIIATIRVLCVIRHSLFQVDLTFDFQKYERERVPCPVADASARVVATRTQRSH